MKKKAKDERPLWGRALYLILLPFLIVLGPPLGWLYERTHKDTRPNKKPNEQA